MLTELIAGGAISVLAFAGYLRIGYLSTQNTVERARADTLLNRALASEGEKKRAETELDFLKQSVVQLMQRPVVAALNEMQMVNITTAIVEAIKDHVEKKDKEKMN